MDLLSFSKKGGIVHASQHEKSVLFHQNPQK